MNKLINELIASVVALCTAGIAYAATPDCNAAATEKKLAGTARDAFIKQCVIEACNASAAEMKSTKDAKANFTRKCLAEHLPPGKEAHAGGTAAPVCHAVEKCSDLSTGLEAPAAGSSADPAANSGHSFVRLRRIPKDH